MHSARKKIVLLAVGITPFCQPLFAQDCKSMGKLGSAPIVLFTHSQTNLEHGNLIYLKPMNLERRKIDTAIVEIEQLKWTYSAAYQSDFQRLSKEGTMLRNEKHQNAKLMANSALSGQLTAPANPVDLVPYGIHREKGISAKELDEQLAMLNRLRALYVYPIEFERYKVLYHGNSEQALKATSDIYGMGTIEKSLKGHRKDLALLRTKTLLANSTSLPSAHRLLLTNYLTDLEGLGIPVPEQYSELLGILERKYGI